jgi:hypothetical protein
MKENLDKQKIEGAKKLAYEPPALAVVELRPEEQLLACHKVGFPRCSVGRYS